MKKTVWLEQVEGGWLRVEGEKTNKIYAEFDRKMELSFMPLVFNFCCRKAVRSSYIICKAQY